MSGGLYVLRHGEIPREYAEDPYPEDHPLFDPDHHISGKNRMVRVAKARKKLADSIGATPVEARAIEGRTLETVLVKPEAFGAIEDVAKTVQFQVGTIVASPVPRAAQSAFIFSEALGKSARKVSFDDAFEEIPLQWSIIKKQPLDSVTSYHYQIVFRLVRAMRKLLPIAKKENVVIVAHNGIKRVIWDLFTDDPKKPGFKFPYASLDQLDLETCERNIRAWETRLSRIPVQRK